MTQASAISLAAVAMVLLAAPSQCRSSFSLFDGARGHETQHTFQLGPKQALQEFERYAARRRLTAHPADSPSSQWDKEPKYGDICRNAWQQCLLVSDPDFHTSSGSKADAAALPWALQTLHFVEESFIGGQQTSCTFMSLEQQNADVSLESMCEVQYSCQQGYGGGCAFVAAHVNGTQFTPPISTADFAQLPDAAYFGVVLSADKSLDIQGRSS